MGRIIYTPGPGVKIRGGDLGPVTNFIEESVSGGAVRIDDGIAMPVKALTASIDALQDDMGYGKVWAAGKGEQLIPYPYSQPAGSVTVNGITFYVYEEGRITATGTAEGTAQIDLCTMTYDTMLKLEAGKTYTAGISRSTGKIVVVIYTAQNVLYQEYSGNVSVSFTLPDDGLDYRCRILLRIASGTVLSSTNTYALKLQEGSAVTAFTPYENICPITGWTGATIRLTGKNLMPNDMSLITEGGESRSYRGYDTFLPDEMHLYMSFTDNDPETDVSDISFGFVDYDFFRRAGEPRALQGWEFRWTLGNGNPDSVNCKPANLTNDNSRRVTSYFMLKAVNEEALGRLFERYKIMVNMGDSAEPWEAYQKRDYRISWEDIAGTVYGGSIDVTQGILTVTHRIQTVTGGEDDWTWTQSQSGTTVYVNGPGLLADSEVILGNYIRGRCNMLNPNAQGYLPSAILQKATRVGGGLCFVDIMNNWGCTAATIEALRARLQALNAQGKPLTIVYKLETPVTLRLKPKEVELLEGTNILRADCGAVSVTYNADTKKYVDRQIADLRTMILENT